MSGSRTRRQRNKNVQQQQRRQQEDEEDPDLRTACVGEGNIIEFPGLDMYLKTHQTRNSKAKPVGMARMLFFHDCRVQG